MKLQQILRRAKKEGWAIGQFNFSTLEQLRGIVLAAKERRAPLILGTSQNEASFFGLAEAVALKRILEKTAKVPLFLHLDHGRDLDFIKKAIEAGYDSVHFDGSDLPFEKNIGLLRKLVLAAKRKNVLVEGELGFLRGESRFVPLEKIETEEGDFTNPKEVKEFVRKSGVKSLAVSIGNVHGIYQKMPKLDFDRLARIRKETSVFLVLHGGSGLSADDFKKAIMGGINKINLNTELRVLWKEKMKKSLNDSSRVKPYEILPEIIVETKKLVEKYLKIFGTSTKV